MAKSPNTNAQVLDLTLSTTETAFAHNLERAAVDGITLRQTVAGSVFRGSTAWDATNIYLTSSVGMTIRFYVF